MIAPRTQIVRLEKFAMGFVALDATVSVSGPLICSTTLECVECDEARDEVHARRAKRVLTNGVFRWRNAWSTMIVLGYFCLNGECVFEGVRR